MARFLPVLALVLSIACQGQPESSSSQEATVDGAEESGEVHAEGQALWGAIDDFLTEHPELGSVTEVESVPDWANGERRRVRLTSGSYLFNFFEGRVVTVYRDEGDRRLEIFREELPDSPPPVAEGARTESEELPAYEILDSVETISDGTMADVLVSSFTKGTDVAERNDFAQAVASKEGLAWVTLYCSRDAFRANYSASFSESHPDALETCYLGSWKRGQGLTP